MPIFTCIQTDVDNRYTHYCKCRFIIKDKITLHFFKSNVPYVHSQERCPLEFWDSSLLVSHYYTPLFWAVKTHKHTYKRWVSMFMGNLHKQ